MIFTHPHPYTSLLTHLQSHLPTSGPLLHRIQYQLTHPSPTAHILTTFPPPSLSPESQTENGRKPENPDEPWLAAYVDIHQGHETQVWIFSSLESTTKSSPQQEEFRVQTRSQLLDLFTKIRAELVPPYIASLAQNKESTTITSVVKTNDTTGSDSTNNAKIEHIKPHPKTSFLIGSLHSDLTSLVVDLERELETRPDEPRVRILRQDISYLKYCFDSSSFYSSSSSLGTTQGASGNKDKEEEKDEKVRGSYRFTNREGKPGLQPHQVELVRSRTHIPRSAESLLSMPSVVLYPSAGLGPTGTGKEGEEMPIAWGFLSPDGSLCTLHVEPEYRGEGLGILVGKEVFGLGTGSVGWGFADVAVENEASRRVMEKMGGSTGWKVAWTVIDVLLP